MIREFSFQIQLTELALAKLLQNNQIELETEPQVRVPAGLYKRLGNPVGVCITMTRQSTASVISLIGDCLQIFRRTTNREPRLNQPIKPLVILARF